MVLLSPALKTCATCSTHGHCSDGACVCDVSWSGPTCAGTLHINRGGKETGGKSSY